MSHSLPRSALVALAVAGCHHAAQAPSATTSLTSAGGRVTITGQLGTQRPFVIRNAETRVRIDGQLFTTAGQKCQSSADKPLSCDLGNGLTLSLGSSVEDGALLLTASVSGSGTHRVDGFEVLATRGSDAQLEPSGQPSTLRYLHNGYQSWSFAGVLDIAAGTTLPRQNDVIPYPAPNGNVAFDEKPGLSSHSAVIDGGDGTALAVGFVSTRLWQGAIALEAPDPGFQLTAQNGFTGDSVSLDAGHVESETLFVKYESSASVAMEAYGQALARRQSTRTETPTTKQRGWFSWNRYFDEIDEKTVLLQASAMSTAVGAQGFNVVEIDDGWEQSWGNWTNNGKFRPIEQLTAERHAAGQKLGLWVAPFVVEETEPVVTEHPDWWVQTAAGQPLVHAPVATPHRLRVVDATQPDALAWMVNNLATLQAKGVDFFKLDYLYAGALDGKRHDPSATGVAALSRGLQAIFDGIGPASVNLCGVPWLHAALAPESTIRISTDVAYKGGPAGFALVGITARNLAARAFGPLARRSDPDQFWLAPLTTDETLTALVLQALAAESFSLADDFSALSAAQNDALQKTAQLQVPTDAGSAFEARGLFDTAATDFQPAVVETISGPDQVHVQLPSVIARGNLLAVTNWGDSDASIDLHLATGEQALPLFGPSATGGKVPLRTHQTGLYRLTGVIK